IAIGAYQAGADPVVDEALAKRAAIQAFLQQRVDEPSTIAEADDGLRSLASTPVPAAEAAMLLGEFADEPVVPAPAPGPVALPPLGLSL
ncbi:MAG: EscN ATPase C-terminal domain, partial [Solirubrobacteraceae bacterium]|nr:EscN ATPase C-terminal domain [Solirubrobacteraceae bacterium]